jgi:Pyridoxamine 5'-phosphate oxidase
MASTDKIEAFLAEPRNVVVAGIRRDGRPHLSPNWFAAELPRFRAIKEKHGMAVLDDEEHLRALAAEGRVLVAFTPDEPLSSWTAWGLD